MMIDILLFITWLICFVYLYWILRLYYSWQQLKPIKNRSIRQDKISILIAIRNEEKHLPGLLKSIQSLNYPKENFETIFIDDHSEDHSIEIISAFKEIHHQLDIQLLSLANDSKGKKEALKLGYSSAKNDIIACTDGDCLLPQEWLSLISNAFENTNYILVGGGVMMNNENNFLDRFQSIELMSLIGSGAGAIGINRPLMCNGANMAFRKRLLQRVNKKAQNTKLASGDDVFLMMECKRIFGAASIGFIKNKEHWVQTYTQKSLSNYLNQRIRWVSKSSYYTDPFQIMLSFIILFQNLILIALLSFALLSFSISQTMVFIIILKILADFIFLRSICFHLSKKKILNNYLLIGFLYPFFITFTAIAGQMSSFQWKGRNYRK